LSENPLRKGNRSQPSPFCRWPAFVAPVRCLSLPKAPSRLIPLPFSAYGRKPIDRPTWANPFAAQDPLAVGSGEDLILAKASSLIVRL
jgi:hypothetical protein